MTEKPAAATADEPTPQAAAAEESKEPVAASGAQPQDAIPKFLKGIFMNGKTSKFEQHRLNFAHFID